MRISLLIFLTISFSINLIAQKVSRKDILDIKNKFEMAYDLSNSSFLELPIIKDNDTLAIVFDYKKAFVVISNNKQLPPIKAYSTENSFPKSISNTPISFEDIISDDLFNLLEIEISATKTNSYKKQNSLKWESIKKYGIKSTKVQYGPYMDNVYGQVNCKNELGNTVNVTNYYTPSNYAVGCVAITLTELLQYHQWPRRGVGSHTYNDNYGSTTGTHSVDFEKKYYNWGLILDEYHHKVSTNKQRAELGNLAYHAAVSVNMDFEYNGSTSNINRIPSAAIKHFRFTSRYIEKTGNSFWNAVDDNIIKKMPVQFAIYTSSGAGHAVVCDGLKPDQDLYHLNMGWWGSSNAWYTIQGSFNAGGYSNITAAVVDFIPIVDIEEPVVNSETESVDLKWNYPTTLAPDAYQLQVKVGAANWKDVAADITEKKYSYKYENTDIHYFKVRAKINGDWINNSYSVYKDINIQNELDVTLPEQLSVYPTIVDSKLNVESKYLAGSTIEIFNTTGLRAYYYEVPSGYGKSKIILDLSSLNTGYYILRIYSEETNQTSQIIKL